MNRWTTKDTTQLLLFLAALPFVLFAIGRGTNWLEDQAAWQDRMRLVDLAHCVQTQTITQACR